jgi:hypothetical protein
MTRKLLVALAAATGAMLLSVPSASAFTTLPVWQCRGSATYTSVSGQNRVEPLVANGNINTVGGASEDRAQCVDSETGAGNTATQLGISPNFVTAVTGKAATSINPDLGASRISACCSPRALRRSASARPTPPRPAGASPAT